MKKNITQTKIEMNIICSCLFDVILFFFIDVKVIRLQLCQNPFRIALLFSFPTIDGCDSFSVETSIGSGQSLTFAFTFRRVFGQLKGGAWAIGGVQEMGVSKNNGTPKSSILIGFSIVNHPFWGTPIFGNTQMSVVQNCVFGIPEDLWWFPTKKFRCVNTNP